MPSGQVESCPGVLAALRDTATAPQIDVPHAPPLPHAPPSHIQPPLGPDIAHDLGHILTIVLNTADTIEARARRPAATRRALSRIADDAATLRLAAGRAAALLAGRTGAGAPASTVLAHDVLAHDVLAHDVLAHDVLDRVARLGRGLAGTTRIVVQRRAPSRRLLIDPVRLDRALLNLLANASAALGGRGRITLRAEPGGCASGTPRGSTICLAQGPGQPGEEVLFTVADDGPGMSDDVLARLAEPRFTTREAAGGSGIGLGVVRAFAVACGGRFDVASAPGVGTTCMLRLPAWTGRVPRARRPPAAALPEPGLPKPGLPKPGLAEPVLPEPVLAEPVLAEPVLPEPAHPKSGGRGARVLFVDDDPLLGRLAARALRRAGWAVMTAETAASALAAIRDQEGFAALVTDLAIGGSSGGELIAELRANGRHPGCLAVIASGASPTMIAHALRERPGDVDLVLPKPYLVGDLAARLDELLARRRVARPGGGS